MRHVFRCRVVESSWDPILRTYTSFVPACTCSWRGEEVSRRPLVRSLWLAHVQALRAVAREEWSI